MGCGQKRLRYMLSKRLGLLIATTGYADPQLPAVPGGSTHISDLADVLRSPKIGGFTLTVLIDPTLETARSAILVSCTCSAIAYGKLVTLFFWRCGKRPDWIWKIQRSRLLLCSSN